MQVTPKTKNEIDAMNLWSKGEYGFEVVEKAKLGENEYFTMDTVSKIKPDGKGGNEMIQLVVNVFHPEGWKIVLMDYLLDAMPEKLFHAVHACGLEDKYNAGALLASDFVGKTGNLKLYIQKGKPKNDGSGENYPDRNAIGNYIIGEATQSTPQKTKTAAGIVTSVNSENPAPADDFDDEMPF